MKDTVDYEALTRSELYSIIQELREENRALTVDAQTGNFSKVFGRQMLTARCAEMARLGAWDSWVIFLDIDDFKRQNDAHGHNHGDSLIATLGGFLSEQFRSTDYVIRWGGDEFVVVVNHCTDPNCLVRKIRTFPAKLTRLGFPCSLSLGICRLTDPVDSVGRADKLMYLSKTDVNKGVLTTEDSMGVVHHTTIFY